MATAPSIWRWCVWPRNSPWARCWWKGRAISVRWMAICRPPCVIPKCACSASPIPCSMTSTRTRWTSGPTMTGPSMSRRFCRRASPICWSMAVAALQWAWPPISRRTISAKPSTPPWPRLKTRPSPPKNCWSTFRARISRPVASSSVVPAFARHTRPAGGRSSCAAARASRKCARNAKPSSSPRFPIR